MNSPYLLISKKIDYDETLPVFLINLIV